MQDYSTRRLMGRPQVVVQRISELADALGQPVEQSSGRGGVSPDA
jgi:hypothetical protein